MLWADTQPLGRSFSKDPAVIWFGGRYLLYYSRPGYSAMEGWSVGVAESRDLLAWTPVAVVGPEREYEKKGLAAPFATAIDGRVHLFYQTYGNGKSDAICHAVSLDGLKFEKDAATVFHPTGSWNAGRAIDAEVVKFKGRWLMYAATRDPEMKVQMIVGAFRKKGWGEWEMLANRPLLKSELPWEQDCIEAPATVVRGDWLYMFYAGAYNNAPQQIGCARSRDGVSWTRVSQERCCRWARRGSGTRRKAGTRGRSWILERSRRICSTRGTRTRARRGCCRG